MQFLSDIIMTRQISDSRLNCYLQYQPLEVKGQPKVPDFFHESVEGMMVL